MSKRRRKRRRGPNPHTVRAVEVAQERDERPLPRPTGSPEPVQAAEGPTEAVRTADSLPATPPGEDEWSPFPSIRIRARKLLAKRNFGEAQAILRVALQEEPEAVELLVDCARAACMLGDYDEAQELLGRAEIVEPDNVEVQREVGMMLFRRGLYEASAEALSIVCARCEADGAAYYYRGESLNRIGQVEEAIRAMERAVALSPGDARALRTMGHLYDRTGRGDRASEMFRRARELDRS